MSENSAKAILDSYRMCRDHIHPELPEQSKMVQYNHISYNMTISGVIYKYLILLKIVVYFLHLK